MNITKLIRDFSTGLQMENCEIPVAIHIGERTARALQEELHMMIKYTPEHKRTFPPNEMMFNGIMLIAPKDFDFGWTTNVSTKEEWLYPDKKS